jgi:uncharacterized iron-regulated protein
VKALAAPRTTPLRHHAAVSIVRAYRCASAFLLVGLVGCAQPLPTALQFDQPIVLLGEVHDNAAQHALRLRAMGAWLARGARPTVVMEQLDRDRQGALDALRVKAARAEGPPADADAVIAAAGGKGWNWAFYRPFIALALRYQLPIVAANVPRDEARQVIEQGLAASGFDAELPPGMVDALAPEILASHCGMLDAAMARKMTLAQVARDQSMARAVEAAATPPRADGQVLLLAGNGHVRTGTGVPRWLHPATRAQSESVGLLEQGAPAADQVPYDHVVLTPPQPRPDPCEAMRR